MHYKEKHKDDYEGEKHQKEMKKKGADKFEESLREREKALRKTLFPKAS